MSQAAGCFADPRPEITTDVELGGSDSELPNVTGPTTGTPAVDPNETSGDDSQGSTSTTGAADDMASSSGSTGGESLCGNGVLDLGEECDSFTERSAAFCNDDCTINVNKCPYDVQAYVHEPITSLEQLSALVGASKISGKLEIEIDDLPDLTPLRCLQSFKGTFLLSYNSSLKNFHGLENVKSLGQVQLFKNQGLENFVGLENVLEIDALFVIDHDNLKNFEGLSNLSHISGLFEVRDNSALIDFTGLDALTELNGVVLVKNNAALSTFSGLDSLTKIGGAFTVENNDGLDVSEAFSGLAALKTIGEEYQDENDLIIRDNDSIGTLQYLYGLELVQGDLIIESNDNLTDIEGNNLKGAIETLGGEAHIEGNG